MFLPFNFMTLETLLPFLLILAVAYGALETVGLFRNKAVKAIIAVVIAFFGIVNYSVVQLINSSLPYVAILFILVFIIGFARKALSGGEKDNTMIIIIIVLILLLVGSIANAQGGFGMLQYNELLWLIGTVLILAVIFAAYRMKEQR
ncbi:MAG: hypothetical protein JSV63_01100 [Candidatus Aenigmatarchaeota archaeon]|nr:MAG: hypothetical protein JSV63_01100 [Candidatus Aenigmarchaeota archaeon]